MPTPEVAAEHAWIWRAWHRLHRDRIWYGGGMGAMIPGAISFHQVVQWCDFHDLHGGAVHELDAVIHAMDAVFMADHQRRASLKS